MFSTAIALVSIMTGVEAPCPREALYAVASELELLDERELKLWGKPWTGFEANELKILHERYEKLHDAPPACDAVRFPPRDICTEIIAWNNTYICYLQDRMKLFPADDWIDDAIADSERIIAVYDLVRDCKCDYFYITARREALAELRNIIGSWDYYSGTLPPVVPVWHFRRVD